jgi:hypothetical protein
MKVYSVFFFILFFSLHSFSQRDDTIRTIEFGFNIHYLNEAEKNIKPLKQIRQDGFTKIRAFEPFTDSLSTNTSALVNKVQFIQSFDFNLLLSLSNFIWQSSIDTTRLVTNLSNRKFISEALKYTNRFPPDDTADYKLFLQKVMDSLQENGCLKSMSFEIGNEPDADRYFWGNADDWRKTALLISDVLKNYSGSVSCCGFSSDLIFLKTAGRDPFLDYINSNDFKDNLSFSYHLYFETYLGKAEINNPQTPKVKNGIITEFGPASSLTAKNIDLLNSSDVMSYLVRLLEFAYTNDVRTVYLFPLMDNKKHTSELGYFDTDGNSKNGYNYLLKLRDVVRNGYSVHLTDDYTEIRGKESILRFVKRTHKIEVKDIIFCTYSNTKQNKIKSGEWLIYKK